MICQPCREDTHILCDNQRLIRPVPHIVDGTGMWCFCQHKARDKP